MPNLFLRTTPLAHSEWVMQIPAGFTPRGGGRRILRYATADCDCRYCTEWSEQDRRCLAGDCPYMNERLDSGRVSLRELLLRVAAERGGAALTARVRKLYPRNAAADAIFRDATHKQRWDRLDTCGLLSPFENKPHLAAAIFLLCSDELLWERVKRHVDSGSLKLSTAEARGVDCEGYTIFKAAKEMCDGECHIQLSELADATLIGDTVFRLIVHAFVICRYGMKALRPKNQTRLWRNPQ